MARRLIRSARSRRIRSRVSPGTGPFRGASTNRRSQARHRKAGVPEWVRPLRTTWAAPQRGHGGIGGRGRDASCMSAGYGHPHQRATTGRLVIEADELWSFVGDKRDVWWVWVALDADTRQ